MKCQCCDVILSDYEATLKHDETGEFLDMCQECIAEILIDTALPIRDNKEVLRKSNIDGQVDSDEDLTDSVHE